MTNDLETIRLSVPDVCRILNCSRGYLNKLHKRGLLTKRHDHRKVFWLKDEVITYAKTGSGDVVQDA